MAKSWNQRPEISKREEPTETMVFCCVCDLVKRISSGLVLVFPKEDYSAYLLPLPLKATLSTLKTKTFVSELNERRLLAPVL